MKITITGKKSEGKSKLALIIHKAIQKYTLYTVSVQEVPNEARNFKSALKMKNMKKLLPRFVKIVVINVGDEDD